MAFSQSVTFTANAPATAADQNAAWDVIEAYLNGALSLAELVGGSAGQIAVVNGSGDLAIVTVSGDATMSSAGALSLASNSVGTPEIGSLPFCELTDTAAQTLSGTTELTFDTEQADTDAMHSAVNPGRITVVTAGVYLINAFVPMDTNVGSGEQVTATIWRNFSEGSATLIGTDQFAPGMNGIAPNLSVPALVKCVAGDYFTVRVAATSAGVDTVGGGSDNGRRFSAAWIGEG